MILKSPVINIASLHFQIAIIIWKMTFYLLTTLYSLSILPLFSIISNRFYQKSYLLLIFKLMVYIIFWVWNALLLSHKMIYLFYMIGSYYTRFTSIYLVMKQQHWCRHTFKISPCPNRISAINLGYLRTRTNIRLKGD